MLLLVEYILIVILGLTSVYILSQWKPKNYPPGPFGIPILGHLTLIGKEPHKTFMKWKGKYGPIISANFGSFKTVVVSDAKIIREMLSENAFSGRPHLQKYIDRSGIGKAQGIIMTQGELWVEQRRFTIKNLRDLGFGKKSMGGIIEEEVAFFIEHLKKQKGKAISTRNIFNAGVVNALWQIVSGEKVNRDDPVIQKVFEAISLGFVKSNKLSGLTAFIPWIGKYFPEYSGYKENVMGIYKPLFEFIESFIAEYKKTHVDGNPRAFIDIFLDEIQKTQNPDSSFYKNNYAEKQLVYLIADLFLAGAETTSTMLDWLTLIVALKPEIQKKIHSEIKQIVGDSRLPSLSDRAQMPYTEAMICETLRFCSITPVGVFHATTKNTKLSGFDIPKGTMIIANLYSAHHDQEIWGDPEEIRPERFLSKDGKTFVKHEALIPFSYGKRICPGENLARDELFLFTTGILQNFEIQIDPDSPRPNLDYISSNVVSPKPHNLIFKPIN